MLCLFAGISVLAAGQEKEFEIKEDPAVSWAGSCLYTDVSPDQWYYGNVSAVSEAGIMKGVGDGRFAPDAEITLAEVYTIAARLHAFFQTGSMDAADEYEHHADRPWHWGYVKYCMDTGIRPGEPGDVTQPASRIECMSLLLFSIFPGSRLKSAGILFIM